MSSSSKSKKSLEKFINNDKEKNNSEKINNKNKFINNDKIPENYKDLLELKKQKNEKNNIPFKIDQEKNNENNQINELIDEGLIFLKKNKNPKDPILDINDIESMNYEKMLKKIIELNRSLNLIQIKKFRLNNERNIFSNGLNEISQKKSSNDDKEKFISSSNEDKNNNLYNYNSEVRLLNHFEEDINFFDELMKEFNENLNIIK